MKKNVAKMFYKIFKRTKKPTQQAANNCQPFDLLWQNAQVENYVTMVMTIICFFQ